MKDIKTMTVNEYGVSSQFSVYTFGSGSPRITFTAGIHGNEVSGIYVAERLISFFEQNPPLKGTVKIIPRVNPAATRCMQRRSPFDGEDLNRIFPGDNGKTISHRLAAAVYEQTADAEILVDLHCCGQHGLPYILSVYTEHERIRELVRSITMPIAIHSGGTNGQLFIESCRKRSQAACIIEIPSGTCGGAINLRFSDVCYFGLMDMLRSQGVAAGAVEGQAPTFYGKLLDINAQECGLWEPCLSAGAKLNAGDAVGKMNGQTVLAPASGLLMSIMPCGYYYDEAVPCVAVYTVQESA